MQDDERLLSELLGGGEDEEPAPAEPTPFERQLAATLTSAVQTMIKDGLIEVDEAHVDALVVEMTESAKDAHSPKHMLKKLTSTLVDSEHVEEIYPSDDKIQDRLKADLGG